MINLVSLKRVFSTEMLKIKNTWAFWASISAPLLVVFLNFVIYYNRAESLIKSGGDPWIIVLRNALLLWSLLLFTLLITVVTFLVNNLEHRVSGWKYLFALPVPKSSIYYGKFFVCTFLILFSLLQLLILSYLSIGILFYLWPEIPFRDFNFHLLILVTFLKIFLASFFVLALQFFFSMRWQNFVLPIGLGIFGTVATVALSSWKYIYYIPYALPYAVTQDLSSQNLTILKKEIVISWIGGCLALYLGQVWNERRQIR